MPLRRPNLQISRRKKIHLAPAIFIVRMLPSFQLEITQICPKLTSSTCFTGHDH